ncbi:hypothetical protein FNV43_RR03843 [Rhamnella rubrinervis]|uniref:Uncharacterized protein n=1 Tax=Rhamnella rubrinervis TaxID=2594499 RepID=A0A8K0HKR7_9ROSA|nr:hypothetical protein FNV43_RR03843 [Rhamnella rubrinervis]
MVLFEACKPKKGEKVFVSPASGSVGDLVGQHAKTRCLSCGWLFWKQRKGEKLGFDDAFNYEEETDMKATLKGYFPDGIDI